MEPTEKKQEEPVFRLQSSVRGEIEWLLMVCEGTDDNFCNIVAELLAGLKRVKILVLCEQPDYAKYAYSCLTCRPGMDTQIAIVGPRQPWPAEPKRCYLVEPPDEYVKDIWKWTRDPFHVLTSGQGLSFRFVKVANGKSAKFDSFVSDVLKYVHPASPIRFSTPNDDDWLTVLGGNLLCDKGYILVGKNEFQRMPDTAETRTRILSTMNGGTTKPWEKIVVVGPTGGDAKHGLVDSVDRFFSTDFWRVSLGNKFVPDEMERRFIHVDYFLTLTGTSDLGGRPILFLGEVCDPLELADNATQQTIEEMNAYLNQIDGHLTSKGFKVLRNKMPMILLNPNTLSPFPYNNCIVSASPKSSNVVMLPCVSHEMPDEKSKNILRGIEICWRQQWLGLPEKFEIRLMESKFKEYAASNGLLHCLTKELLRASE